ncbi:MAG: barnase inhibitor barstar [Deltaproteobacteria bacterium]|nr:barnase inhibitor barstar [Deltaproteobacteria bacterium]
MPIKRCTLDGRSIHSLDDLYDRLASRLALPGHFGRNLDALRDVLSTDVEGPFEIVWKHARDSKRSMGKDYDRAVKLLREQEKERDDFKLTIEQQ